MEIEKDIFERALKKKQEEIKKRLDDFVRRMMQEGMDSGGTVTFNVNNCRCTLIGKQQPFCYSFHLSIDGEPALLIVKRDYEL